MKTEKVLSYRDEKFELEAINLVSQTTERMQTLVDEFNALKLGDVQPNELEIVIKNPKALYDKRLLLIEVPKGLSRVKYLELVELPTLALVTNAREALLKLPYCFSFELFNLENGVVKTVAKELTALINSNNVYLTKGSNEHFWVKTAVEACRLLNDLNELTGYQMIDPYKNSLNGFFKIEQISGDQSTYRLLLEREHVLKFVGLGETFPPVNNTKIQ
ncbi:MAG: hypothetical protein PHD06_05210 [Bacteroidales bacterium]|nr:hypothetical protein [Bacteroidales bacterium]